MKAALEVVCSGKPLTNGKCSSNVPATIHSHPPWSGSIEVIDDMVSESSRSIGRVRDPGECDDGI
jgi:hypothetical protein